MNKPQQITCSYSILDEGRIYTGNHRKYLIENAREICYSAPTREKIALREALGFYGHGRRIFAGKVNIGEVETISTPDGGIALVSNIPSNVTVAFDVAEDGTVKHTQEILDTETGKIVNGLHNSRVGGFSWACKADDGGTKYVTRLTGFSGFDYVLKPNFSSNRGYVLESADAGTEQLVLESVAATLKDDEKARQYVRGWTNDFNAQISQLENQLFKMEACNADLKAKDMELHSRVEQNASEMQEMQKNVIGIMQALQEALPIFIPEGAMHSMLNGDFARAKAIFESASAIQFEQFPVGLPGTKVKNNLEINNKAIASLPPEYGSAAYGEGLFNDKYNF